MKISKLAILTLTSTSLLISTIAACTTTGGMVQRVTSRDEAAYEPVPLYADDEANDYADTYAGAEEVASMDGAYDMAPTEAAPAEAAPISEIPWNTERYRALSENDFSDVKATPLSTFSIDVDTAGYSIIRRYLTAGSLPPSGAVRIEEMLNYFQYSYKQPTNDQPFAVHTRVAVAPWNKSHHIARIAIKGRDIDVKAKPQSNLVFLIDVSGSMEDENKLPLLKRSLSAMVEKLDSKDSVSTVVYAGASGIVLYPTSDKDKILASLDNLSAGGGTNGAEGIEAAYGLAAKNFNPNGVNRVILATDGDFNIGTTSESDLVKIVEKKAKKGIFLSVLGFGSGNYNDSMMEQLADRGNGNYAYIDTFQEANKVLVEQLTGTLITIASDVKIQVEFNPALVSSYRLIGYENRALAAEDFNDDKKDAGEIGAGHSVTALYEVIPTSTIPPQRNVDALRYQKKMTTKNPQDELFTVKVRYKRPGQAKSTLLTTHVKNKVVALEKADRDFRFATAVAEFGLKLRNSSFAENVHYRDILALASTATESSSESATASRQEFIDLVKAASKLDAHH